MCEVPLYWLCLTRFGLAKSARTKVKFPDCRSSSVLPWSKRIRQFEWYRARRPLEGVGMATGVGSGRLCRAPERLRAAMGSGFRVQDSGFRVQGPGFRVQPSGYRVRRTAHRRLDHSAPGVRDIQKKGLELGVQDVRFRVCRVGTWTPVHTLDTRAWMVGGLGWRAQGSGFRIQGSGFRVQGSGFRVQGSGFRGQGLGYRVQGVGFAGWVPGHPRT